MSVLDGFVLVTNCNTFKRPPRGQKRITVSSRQVTFSKELVTALGSPKAVSIYRNDEVRLSSDAGCAASEITGRIENRRRRFSREKKYAE